MKTRQVTLSVPVLELGALWRIVWRVSAVVLVTALLWAIGDVWSEYWPHPMTLGFWQGVIFSSITYKLLWPWQ